MGKRCKKRDEPAASAAPLTNRDMLSACVNAGGPFWMESSTAKPITAVESENVSGPGGQGGQPAKNTGNNEAGFWEKACWPSGQAGNWREFGSRNSEATKIRGRRPARSAED